LKKNLFHSQNRRTFVYNSVTKDPTSPQVCRYIHCNTALRNVSVLKATIEQLKQDNFCNNIF